MKRFVLAFLCAAGSFAALASGANAQSFDCSDRLAPDEQAICDSPALSRLDLELSDVYEDALSRASENERDRLRSEQRDWIEARQGCRSRETCLNRLYRDRISELEDLNQSAGRSTRLGEASDGRDQWAALGSVDAGDYREPLSILVGFSRGRFDALQLRVRDADARIQQLTVIYGNGMAQRFTFRRPFRAGQLSDRIELRTRVAGRFIERIEIEARAPRGARIDVIGRRVDRGLARNRPPAWERDTDRELRDQNADRERDVDRDRYADRDPGRFEDRNFDRRNEPDRRDETERGTDRYSDSNRERVDRDEQYRTPDRGAPDQTARNDYGDQDRAVVSRVQLLDFVKNVFHHTAEMSATELRETYAPHADYYGERNKSVEDIIADKRNYAERWSDRAFRVREETFRYQETPDPGVFELTYTYDFHVRGNGRESKGSGETTLLVDTNGASYVIRKEDGKVLQRL